MGLAAEQGLMKNGIIILFLHVHHHVSRPDSTTLERVRRNGSKQKHSGGNAMDWGCQRRRRRRRGRGRNATPTRVGWPTVSSMHWVGRAEREKKGREREREREGGRESDTQICQRIAFVPVVSCCCCCWGRALSLSCVM